MSKIWRFHTSGSKSLFRTRADWKAWVIEIAYAFEWALTQTRVVESRGTEKLRGQKLILVTCFLSRVLVAWCGSRRLQPRRHLQLWLARLLRVLEEGGGSLGSGLEKYSNLIFDVETHLSPVWQVCFLTFGLVLFILLLKELLTSRCNILVLILLPKIIF